MPKGFGCLQLIHTEFRKVREFFGSLWLIKSDWFKWNHSQNWPRIWATVINWIYHLFGLDCSAFFVAVFVCFYSTKLKKRKYKYTLTNSSLNSNSFFFEFCILFDFFSSFPSFFWVFVLLIFLLFTQNGMYVCFIYSIQTLYISVFVYISAWSFFQANLLLSIFFHSMKDPYVCVSVVRMSNSIYPIRISFWTVANKMHTETV